MSIGSKNMQTAEQAQHQIPGRFRPGQSGNPRGRISRAEQRAMIESALTELASEFGGGGSLSATEKLLLRQAATLTVMSRPRNPVDQVRHANAIARAIAAVRRGRGARRTLLRLPARP
jgi:hypothetical protein